MPKDVILDLPRISVCGDREIYIENHKGIMEYTDSSIRIKTDKEVVHINGSELRIIVLKSDRMVINGVFESVDYEKINEQITSYQNQIITNNETIKEQEIIIKEKKGLIEEIKLKIIEFKERK